MNYTYDTIRQSGSNPDTSVKMKGKKMKTYSGELKDGMPIFVEGDGFYDGLRVYDMDEKSIPFIKEVYHDNEWQLYKPQAKNVWGIPEEGQNIYTIYQGAHEIHKKGKLQVHEWCHSYGTVGYAFWLSKHHAEQHAKAMNYINEFRALSDVPVDGVEQWVVDAYGEVNNFKLRHHKIQYSICGYVANSKEKAERDLAAYPKIALAHKINTWAFHGIVEEVL